MRANYQLISFPIPTYLETYFASKLNSTIEHLKNGIRYIEVSRHTLYGKDLHLLLTKRDQTKELETKANLYIKFSDWSGNYNSAPRGDLYFYDIPEHLKKRLVEIVKDDFDDALLAFVKGAEFAHAHNGWMPDQKRKGIRKKAISEFCLSYNANFTKKDISKFIKMVQRAKINHERFSNKLSKKLYQHLSF